MDSKERVALIRKGNEHFNKGEIENALKIFVKTDYKDGIGRIGDFYFKKNQPLIALKFYKKANMQSKVNEIFERITFALGQWINEDKANEKNKPNAKHAENSVAVNVSPELKKIAQNIIKQEEKQK